MNSLKSLVWSGNSRDRIKDLPEKARRALGYQLFQLQLGSRPVHTKPFKTGGFKGIFQLKHVDDTGWYRVLYVSKNDNIYILHAFQKKSNKTTSEDSNLAKTRYMDCFVHGIFA